MKFMNDYDLGYAIQRFDAAEATNRLAVARLVDRLRVWTNSNSDGWAYWPKPCRAAAKAMTLIESRTWAENEAQEETDATDAEVKAALRPIKAFLTRHGASQQHRDWIIGSLA